MAILETFTFERDNLKSTAVASAMMVHEHIGKAQAPPAELTKVESNIIGNLRSYLGVVREADDGTNTLTEVGAAFERMYEANQLDAWRWLLTRSLWRYVVPNGTRARVNTRAQEAGVSFNFFRMMVQLCAAMASQERERRFVYYEEVVPILADDQNWALSGIELFEKILAKRDTTPWPDLAERRSLLDDLETEFDVRRDHLNTVLNKAMHQTGLFDHSADGGRIVGIAISTNLDPALQTRLRHVLDHDLQWQS